MLGGSQVESMAPGDQDEEGKHRDAEAKDNSRGDAQGDDKCAMPAIIALGIQVLHPEA